MISLKLLNEVLRTSIQIGDFYIKDNILSYSYCRSDNEWIAKKINIYELSNKCKEWALSKGFIIDSRIRGYCKGKALCVIYKDDWTSEFEEHCLYTCEAETEIFAIFKACERILNKLREEK